MKNRRKIRIVPVPVIQADTERGGKSSQRVWKVLIGCIKVDNRWSSYYYCLTTKYRQNLDDNYCRKYGNMRMCFWIYIINQ